MVVNEDKCPSEVGSRPLTSSTVVLLSNKKENVLSFTISRDGKDVDMSINGICRLLDNFCGSGICNILHYSELPT